MTRWIPAAIFSFVLMGVGAPQAAQIEREKVDVLTYSDFAASAALEWEDVYLPTRKGVRQRLLIAKAANSGDKAVVLFAGGKGTPITRKRGRRLKTTGNFLVRSAPLFARAGFVAAIADAPSDESGGMSDHFRSSKAHHADIRAAVDFLVREGAREVFPDRHEQGHGIRRVSGVRDDAPECEGLRPYCECGDDNL